MNFAIYNPNLNLVNEKRVVVEFLETGGFINLEHDSLIINMKLYRTTGHNVQSTIILILGLVMIVLSIYDINQEYEEAERIKEAKR